MLKTKIFYIGLSRTGTSSLHHILSELGLRSDHFCGYLLLDPPNYKKCEDYDCLGDTPVPLLYKKLDKRFEGSKFILTIREKEQWLESMKWMFSHGKVIWEWNQDIHNYHRHFYGCRSYNKEILSAHWDRYHNDVLDYFSDRPSDLMIIKLEEGFDIKRISEFIDVPYYNIQNTWENSRRYATFHCRVIYCAKDAIRRLHRLLTNKDSCDMKSRK